MGIDSPRAFFIEVTDGADFASPHTERSLPLRGLSNKLPSEQNRNYAAVHSPYTLPPPAISQHVRPGFVYYRSRSKEPA